MSVPIEILVLVLAVAPIAAAGPPPAAAPLVTDGRFDDWPEVHAVLEDPVDAAPGAAVDLGALRVFDEPAYLHLDLELRRPVNAQGLRGSIRILLDGDGDPATGATVGGLPGTDAVVILSRLDRPRGGGFGAGTGIQPVLDGSPGEILPPSRAGLLAAPTWAAPRLEIRIDRGLALGGPELLTGASLRLKVVYETEGPGGEPADQTAIGSYRFRTAYRPPPAPAPFDLSKPQGAFRVVAWNVAGRGLGDTPGPFARILSAIEPDVVLLDEAHGSLTREELAAFFARVSPVEESSRWSFVAGESGGRQRGIVASRLPLRPEPSLLGALPYPEEALDRLAAEVAEGGFRALLDLERRVGLAIAGAWVATGAGEVLFVPVDLQSRGFLDSPEDRLRVLQARAIGERVRAALAAAGSAKAVVIAGDLNLVGGPEPLEVLAAGLDPRGGDLTVAECPALDGRSQVTWRATNNPDSLYGPGRLDFHLHSASRLEAVKGFVFDAGALPEEQRRRLGIEKDDSRITSDHLPVVADYRWRRTAGAAGSDTVSP